MKSDQIRSNRVRERKGRKGESGALLLYFTLTLTLFYSHIYQRSAAREKKETNSIRLCLYVYVCVYVCVFVPIISHCVSRDLLGSDGRWWWWVCEDRWMGLYSTLLYRFSIAYACVLYLGNLTKVRYVRTVFKDPFFVL